MALESVLVAIDGESKCGKTTVINTIAQEADWQAGMIPWLLGDSYWQNRLDAEAKEGLAELQDMWGFNHIIAISGGNAYRAAALYKSLLELEGISKDSFSEADIDHVRELLATGDMEHIVQTDPNVGRDVSRIAKTAGIHTVCDTLICDYVMEAYHRDGGENLVIHDARDPVGRLIRHNLVGHESEQIDPKTIIPIYIDTPADVAASRMPGNYDENLAIVLDRRHDDATRQEFPVRRPDRLINKFSEWRLQWEPAFEDVPAPLLLDNGEAVSLDNIQYGAGQVAMFASDVAIYMHRIKNGGVIA